MRAAQLQQERLSPVSITYGTWLRSSEVMGPKVSQRLLSGMRLGGTNGSIGSIEQIAPLFAAVKCSKTDTNK